MTTASDLPAGRELDALVAEKVMGLGKIEWMWCKRTDFAGDPFCVKQPCHVDRVYGWRVVPRYSTDIAAAWTVLDKMQERGFAMRLNQFCTFKDHPLLWHWACEIATSPVSVVSSEFEPTAELALCRAALKAVGHG